MKRHVKSTAGVSLLAILIALLWTVPARSETVLYVYIDENGAYHFSTTKVDQRYRRVELWKNKVFVRDFNAGKYDGYIFRMGTRYGVDPMLIKAVIRAESAWDHTAVSSAGAMGLMQLMPGTAKKLEVEDPFDPYQNIEAGAKYLRLMLDTFNNDIILALAAYNAGPAAVQKYKGVPPYKETRNYVKTVLRYYREYLNAK